MVAHEPSWNILLLPQSRGQTRCILKKSQDIETNGTNELGQPLEEFNKEKEDEDNLAEE